MTAYAFDADVLIYAAAPGHPLGRRVWELLDGADDDGRFGSVLLVPELLTKPLRTDERDEVAVLEAVLARLDLVGLDLRVAALAAELGAAYAFVTNNRRDFKAERIAELDVVFPADL